MFTLVFAFHHPTVLPSSHSQIGYAQLSIPSQSFLLKILAREKRIFSSTSFLYNSNSRSSVINRFCCWRMSFPQNAEFWTKVECFFSLLTQTGSSIPIATSFPLWKNQLILLGVLCARFSHILLINAFSLKKCFNVRFWNKTIVDFTIYF